MFKPDIDHIKQVLLHKGYSIFSGTKPYNLNIVGIRSNTNIPNYFDDTMAVFCNESTEWERIYYFKVTTDPGLYWLQHPMCVDGTAIMVPGQYKSAYQIGLHKGYRALVQIGPITYVRDANRDNKLDFELINNPHKIITGIFATNIHHAGAVHESIQVDKWSAGCQVFADPVEFAQFMNLCDKSAELYGNKFTYTLLDQKDFELAV